MDRESESSFRSQCVHSKNVFSLADLSPIDETYHKIKKHVDDCRICSSRYAQFAHQVEAMKMYIPKPMMDRESKENFEREVSELFKNFNLDRKSAAKAKLKQKIKSIDSAGADILGHLTSKTMLKGYLAALIVFGLLKFFFN